METEIEVYDILSFDKKEVIQFQEGGEKCELLKENTRKRGGKVWENDLKEPWA